MNRKNVKKYINLSILVLFVIILPFYIRSLVRHMSVYIDMYIALFYPSIRYEGNKSVPEEDIINYEKITFRDLRLDEYNEYSERFYKFYIVKKNHISKKKIYRLLSNYCKEYYENHNSYDKIGFFFYGECGMMPWFWNNDGFFPDLEMNSENLMCRFFASKDGIELKKGCR